ncbi:MAG: efflux RND transporter permease subunit [Phycisphaerae bacterium]|nr:efflux RND transporter permease subunit [Phycisphaerae bacterium]
MQRLADICIRRPVFAAMMNLALVIIGLVSYSRLGVDRLPSVDVPTVRVQTTLSGASPEEVETQLADEIEEAVNTVEGIDELRSVSLPDRANVIANFNLDRDVDAAAQDVRDRVASIIRNLPDDADPPTVRKVDNDSEPVITIAISGPRSVRELTEIADKVVRVRLERSPGVGEIRLTGGLARTMNIWVDADRLDAYGISITAVRDAIAAQNSDIPGGNVTAPDRELALRMSGRFLDVSGFHNLVVANRDGVPIRIADLGRAEDGTAEARTIARLNGEPTVVLEIIRQSDANTVAVIEGIKENLAAIRSQLPSDIGTVIIRDQSNYIYSALHEINVHLILGSVLASIVVLAFMRSWRSTLIAAIAIPTSVIATFGMMDLLGFTLNSITMLALVLMVGVVIDDAIVVLENIFRFIEEKGMSPMQAAKEATAEIGLAVLATTLSLVVIFVPVSFMSSVAGRFLYQFGLTAAVAVLVSMFVSFTLTPMMSARMLSASDASAMSAPASRRGFYSFIDRRYERLIRWSMRHRLAVAGIAILTIASAFPMFFAVGREFVPADVDEAEFSVSTTAPEGTSMLAMSSAMAEVERVIRETKGVRDVLLTSGGFAGSQVNSASFYVRIAPHDERVLSLGRIWRSLLALDPMAAFRGNYKQSDVMSDIDRRLARFSEVRNQVRNFQAFNIGGGPFDVNLVIRGPELEKLFQYGEELRRRAIAVGGFRGLDTSLRLNKPELRVSIDRDRAADLGVEARDIGTALRVMVGGDDEVTRFRDPTTNEQYEVRLRLMEDDRNRPEIIDQLKLAGGGGALVELSSVASIEPILSASRIDRLDRQRLVSVRGGVSPGYALGDRLEVLRDLSEELGMPQGYTTSFTGRSRELERTFTEFALAFALSIVFMYLILASQFESLTHPFTILLSIPLSVPFALLALLGTGGTLNMFSALGILVLFGVVKKNAILQIDHMNALRRSGHPRLDAIVRGNRDRLRPILMTTFALVAGMLPLALGTGPGAEERRAVAIVVIGGQSLCLVLSLLVTPVAYSLLDDVGTWMRERWPKRFAAPAAVPAAESPR